MLEFIEYIIRIIQVIPWLVMGASLVAALTPTPVDDGLVKKAYNCLLYTSPSPRDKRQCRMPSSA